MAFGSLIDQIKTTKRQRAVSAKKRFYILLKDLSSGSQIDAVSAAEAIDDAGKTEEDLDKDLPIMQERIRAVAELSRLRKVEKALPALEAKAKKAKAELDEAINRLKPIADAAEYEFLTRQTEAGQATGIQTWLFNNVLDPDIIEEHLRLMEENREMADKLQPIDEDLRTERTKLESIEANIETAQNMLARTSRSNTPSYSSWTENLEKYQSELPDQRQLVKELELKAAPFKKRRQEIEGEMAELRERMLQP